MSINPHLNKKSGTIDNIESLIYTLFKLSKISLPWENIEISNLYRNKAILEMKQQFNFEKICGVEYEFLSKGLVYLKKIKEGNYKLDFDVINEIIKEVKNYKNPRDIQYDSQFCFLDLLKTKLREFIQTDYQVPKGNQLLKLFQAYPIDFKLLYQNLIK